MNRAILAAGLAAAVLGLSGCDAPKANLADETVVRYDHIAFWQSKDVAAAAAEHCARYGKQAREVPDNTLDGTVTFVCE